MTHQPTLRPPGKGRTVAIVGDVYRFLATGADTGGKYAANTRLRSVVNPHHGVVGPPSEDRTALRVTRPVYDAVTASLACRQARNLPQE